MPPPANTLPELNIATKMFSKLIAQTIEFTPPTTNRDFIGFVNTIGLWFYRLAIPVAVIVIIYAGAILMLSQGNSKAIERGRKMLTYAVIGLAVLLIGRGFFTLIKDIINLGNR